MAQLTIDSLLCVREALYDVRNSWYDIGLGLRVSPTTLDNIRSQFDDSSECLREMLKVWLKGLHCSWKDIVTALKTKALREITGALATEIEKEYCTETAVEKAAENTTGSKQESVVAELQAEVRKLKSEVSVLKTQQRLDQGDYSSVEKLTFKSGMDVSTKANFVITSDKAHTFEMKHLGLQIHVPNDALPPGVTEATVHVQASLSGQYCMPDGFELASAVYWFSAPVKFSHPVRVEIQHNAAFEDPSSKLCFTICKCPMGVELRLPYTFEKLEGGGFTGRNGSITVPGFSGLGIIMPKGAPQYYLSQLWYVRRSENEWSVYYIVTKDLVAFKSAVEACYSDEGCQGNCDRICFEGGQIMMDIPMEGIRTGEWEITPLYSPVILKEDANSFTSGRLPVCELAVQWVGTSASNIHLPARFTLNINLLGAKAPGSVVLDIKTGDPQHYMYLSQLWYAKMTERSWNVYYVITKNSVALKSAVEAYFSSEARQGICKRIDFEGSQITLDIPMEGIETEGWIITPLHNSVIRKEDGNSFTSGRLPVCQLLVTWGVKHSMLERRPQVPKRFIYPINLLGAKTPETIVLDIIPSALNSYRFKLFYDVLDDFTCDVYWAHENWRKYTMNLGAIEGPEMMVTFQSHEISLEIPAAKSGWRVIPLMPKLQVSRSVIEDTSIELQFRVKRDTNTQEPLNMEILLKGAKPPNNFITVLLDPSVWGAQKSVAIGIQQREIQEEECYHFPYLLHEKRFRPSSTVPPVARALVQKGHTKMHGHIGGEEGEVTSEVTEEVMAGQSTGLKLYAPPFSAELRAEPDLPDLINLVAIHIPSKWRLVGIQLRLKDSELDVIEVTSDDPLRCFSLVFTLWKRKETRLPLSWWTVLQALETASVGEQRLARRVRSKLTTPSHE